MFIKCLFLVLARKQQGQRVSDGEQGVTDGEGIWEASDEGAVSEGKRR